MLKIDNMSYFYNNSKKGIFDISFTLRDGEILAVVGNNGSGKTTLLNQLYAKFRENAAFVPQFFNISSISVRDFVGLGFVSQFKKFQLTHNNEQKARIEEILETTGLSEISNSPMNKISGGERQIAKIAQALAIKPKILLLDEPISHLDLYNSVKVMSLIKDVCRKENACVVVVLHDIYSVRENTDFVLMLKDGKQFGFCRTVDFSDETVFELFSFKFG